MNLKKLLLTGAFAVATMAMALPASAVTKLAFALDDSGSVDSGEFDFIQNGLANALGVLPTDGSYEVTVVAFSSSATTVTATPVLVDSAATLLALQNTIKNYNNRGGGTDIGTALTLINSIHGDIGSTRGFVNVVTDGVSSAFQPEATALAGNGWDSLSFEAVTSSASTALLTATAFPAPSVLLNEGDAIPNPLNTGFVIKVDTFAGFEAVIGSKVQKIIDVNDPSAVPVPAALPLVLSGFGIMGFVARRRNKAA